MPMGGNIDDVFGTILFGSILLPVAFSVFFATNTSGWDATTLLIWAIFPTLGLVSIVYGMWKGKKSGRF